MIHSDLLLDLDLRNVRIHDTLWIVVRSIFEEC